MDTALTDLSKVVDFSSNQLSEMADSAVNLGKQLGQSSVEIMKGMAEFGRVAKNQKDIIELTRVAGMASNVTTMSAADAAKNITSSMITFGIEAKDSMKILNSWNEIQNNFRVSAEDLAASISKIGAASRLANTDMQDLEGMSSAIVQSLGISGNEAGTALKSFMSRIYRTDESDPEELGKTAKALKSIMDIDTSKANGELKSFNSLISEIQSGWGKMSKQEQLAVAQSMGSTYHYSKFVALMENYQIKLDAAAMARNSENSALEENAKKLDSISGRLGLLKVASEEFWRSLIDSNALKSMVSSLTYLVSTFANLRTIIMTAVSALLILKGTQIASTISTWSSSFLMWSTSARTATISSTLFNSSIVQTQARLAGLSFAEIGAMTTTTGLGVSIKSLGFAFKGLLASIGPIGLLVGAITAVSIGMSIYNQKQEENAMASEQASQKLNQEQDALSGLSEEYSKIIQSGDKTAESKSRLKGIQNELIKTYGIEAEGLDLVNGKYTDQIALINKVISDKAKEQLASMGNSGAEALANSTRVLSSQFGAGDSRGNRSVVDPVFNSIVGKSVGESTQGKELFEVNGTLKERVAILEKLKLSLDKTNANDVYSKSVIKDVTDEYNKLNSEMKANQTVLDKYLENKNIVDFYDSFKSNIGEVSDLMSKFLKNPNDTGLTKQLNELHDKMINLADSKGRLGDFQSFIDELFGGIPNKANDASDGTNNFSNSLKTLQETMSTSASSISDIQSAMDEYNESGKFNLDTIIKLSKTYPKLLEMLGNESKIRDFLTSKIKEEQEVSRRAYAQMLMDSEEFYKAKVLGNAQVMDALSKLYNGDLSQYKSLAEAKAKVDQELIQRLASLWSNYYRAGALVAQPLDGGRTVVGADGSEQFITPEMKAQLSGLKEYSNQMSALASAMDGIAMKGTSGIDFSKIGMSGSKASGSKDKTDKTQDPSYTDPTDALIAEANAQSLLTKAKSDAIQKEIDQAKSAKDYSLILLKTTELIANQKLELQQLNDARTKINTAKDTALSSSPFGDTSRWFNDANEASSNYVNEFNNSTAEVQKTMESTFSVMQKLRKGWVDNKKSVDELTDSQVKLKQSLQDIITTQADEAVEALKASLENQKKLDDEACDAKIKNLDATHQKVLDYIDEELSAQEDAINKQISLIDELANAEDYNKNLSSKQTSAQETQNQINILSRDTSPEGKAKLAELQKTLATQNSEIEDLQNSHSRELRKQNLQDALDAIKKESEAKKNSENEKYNATKDRLSKEKAETDTNYTAMMGSDQTFAALRQAIIDGNIVNIKEALLTFNKDFTKDLTDKADAIDKSFQAIIATIKQVKDVANTIPEIPANAKGTKSSASGLSIVDDGNGRELIRTPNGKMYLGDNSGPKIVNLPEGSEVLNNSETEDFLKKTSSIKEIPRYASGIGNLTSNTIISDIISKFDIPSLLKSISLPTFSMPSFQTPQLANNISTNTNVTIPKIEFNVTAENGEISKKNLQKAADYVIRQIEKAQTIRGR